MSAILYNTSSTLIPKFQRNTLQKHFKDSPAHSPPPPSRPKLFTGTKIKDNIDNLSDDVPFKSKSARDSNAYLKELCCSIYPSSLHQKINKLEPTVDLPVHAFVSLILKSFVTSWYGVKIPTSEDQFVTQLFDIVQHLLSYIRNKEMDYECILADDLPMLLGDHIRAMRQSLKDEDVFAHYCHITMHQDECYPEVLTGEFQLYLKSESMLQRTFLNAFFNDFLMGKLLDRTSEPYFVLRAVTDICRHTRQKTKQNKQVSVIFSSQSLKNAAAIVGKILTSVTSMSRGTGYESKTPFSYRYLFTFLFTDLLRFPNRKPYLYAVGKSLQYWTAKSTFLDKSMQYLFAKVVSSRISDEKKVRQMFLNLRKMIFPHDNKMGSGTIIPTGEAFERIKSEFKLEVWHTLQRHRMDVLLNVTESDIEEWTNIICQDKRCNKLLVFRILDCIMAYTKP